MTVTEAQIEIPGRTLFHTRQGSGDPLLLIQGMSGTHASWGDPFISLLAQDFDVVAYDHRGIGRSGPTTDSFTIADLAGDAAALLDALGWQTAHVLGISMGGMVAQELVLAHPERVRTLALGCTYCGGPESSLAAPELMQGMAEAMMSGDRERAIRAGYEANASAAFVADEANWPAFLAMATSVPVALQTILLQMQAIAGHDTSARLGEVRTPTLVLHGTEDQMIPYANGQLIARLIPPARLDTFEGVGHVFWWEQPERAAAVLREHARSGVVAD